MAAVEVLEEPEAAAPTARRRERHLAGLVAALLGGIAMWLVVALSVTPVEHGSSWSEIQCEPEVLREDDEVFGVDATVLTYTEGARCWSVASLRNPAFVPVTVVGVPLHPDDLPLSLEAAERSRTLLYEGRECIGCDETFVPMSPIRLPRGAELAVRTSGTMSGCTPAGDGGGFKAVIETLQVDVRVLGITRTVRAQRSQLYAVEAAFCGTPDGPQPLPG